MSRLAEISATRWELRLSAFLRAELAPAPGRALAAARIVVAIVVTTVLVMALHAPHASYAIVTILMVSQANAGASLAKAILRVLGTVIGAGLGIFMYTATLDQPWLRVVALGPVAAFFVLLSQTTTVPYFGFLAGITAMMVMTATGNSAEHGLEVGLWRFAMVLLGTVIGTGSQIFLWPGDPEKLLLESLVQRMKAVEEIVAARCRGTVARTGASEALLLTGLTHQLDLLDHAESRYPSLRQHHLEQVALIGGVEQLLTAALSFAHRKGDLPAAVRPRLAEIADACSRVREALEQRKPIDAWNPLPNRPSNEELIQGGGAGELPMLVELEQILQGLPRATGFLEPGHRPTGTITSGLILDAPTRGAFFTPAFSLGNTDVMHFSLRVGVAAILAYVAYEGMAWPGLSTAVWTTLIVAQATLGASLQKAFLRLLGAVLGGAIGILTIVVLMPVMTSLASLLVVTTAVFFLAAWIMVGSARISYVGIQIGFAFALSVLNEPGPTTDLAPARDRVAGIILGILTSFLVFQLSGGVALARVAMRRSLSSAFRSLAGLSRVGLSGEPTGPDARPVRGWRWKVYQDLSNALRLQDESKFEWGARRVERVVERRRVTRLVTAAQATFLSLLALVHHRLAVDLSRAPAGIREALRALAEEVVESFQRMGHRVDGGTTGVEFDLEQRLAVACHQMDTLPAGVEPGLQAHLRGRLSLYEDLVSHLRRIHGFLEDLHVPGKRTTGEREDWGGLTSGVVEWPKELGPFNARRRAPLPAFHSVLGVPEFPQWRNGW